MRLTTYASMCFLANVVAMLQILLRLSWHALTTMILSTRSSFKSNALAPANNARATSVCPFPPSVHCAFCRTYCT